MPALTSAEQARSWVSQVKETLGSAYGLMSGRDAEIDSLINAAKAQGYVQRPAGTTGPPLVSRVVRELEESDRSLRELSVYAVSTIKDISLAAISLGLQLDEWEATRPSLRYRLALTVGLVVGAAVFVVGVVVPILNTSAPDWLTVYVPIAAFAILAVNLVILAFIYVMNL